MISSCDFALLRFMSVDLQVTTQSSPRGSSRTDGNMEQLIAKPPHTIIKLNLATLMGTKLSGDMTFDLLNDMLHSIMLLVMHQATA